LVRKIPQKHRLPATPTADDDPRFLRVSEVEFVVKRGYGKVLPNIVAKFLGSVLNERLLDC
jgi:hypothetical protein